MANKNADEPQRASDGAGETSEGGKPPGKTSAAERSGGPAATADTKTSAGDTAGKATAETARGFGGDAGLPDPTRVALPWCDNYPPNVPATYPYPQVPLTRLLDDAAIDFPRSEALYFLGASMTYRQLLDEVDRFASALAALGVAKGERVGVVLPNCPQHVVAVFAVLRLGAVVVESDPMDSDDELAHRISDAGCRLTVCLDPVYPRLARMKGRIPSVRHMVVTGIQDALPFPKNRLFPLRGRRDGTYHKIAADEPVLRMGDLIRRTTPAPPPVEVDPAGDVAMLLYTAGTDGASKGVVLTHANLVTNAFQLRLWVPDIQSGAENVLCVLPLSLPYGMSMCLGVGVLSAATLTLLPRFDVDTTLRTIVERRPTLFPGVPMIYAALTDAGDVDEHDLSSIRVSLCAGGPLPVGAMTAFERLTGGKVRQAYGLTEAGPITHANPIYGKAKTGSVGLPLADTVCTLRDVDDPTRPAPQGGPGELAVAGPQVMTGYWDRSEETAAALVGDWLLTGDIATVDDDGYFFVLGRKADLIPVGGYYVYPGEVEEALSAHPAVRHAAVVGVAGERGDRKVKACVVLEEKARITDDELLEFLGRRLVPHKLPRHIEFRAELPRDVVGRVVRRRLADRGEVPAE